MIYFHPILPGEGPAVQEW